MWTHTVEKPCDLSIHTREDSYIFNFIVVRFIKKQFTKVNPVKAKINYLVTETHGHKTIAYSMLKSSLIILFCIIDVDFHQIASFLL